jgi:phytoene dehydrogenase-like protein
VRRVIVIGAGHNGLTAAFHLAKAGLKPLVLEAREVVGGGAVTSDLHPGFRCPTLSHRTLLRSDLVREMDLERRGVEFLRSPVDVFAPSLDGPPLTIYADDGRTVESIRRLSARDAESFPAYREAMRHVTSVLAPVLASPAPDISDPDAGDLWNLLKAGRRFRGLGKKDAYRLLRWVPMPVADLAREWFESDLLRAAVAAPGLSGTMLGPRSAGSALVLMLQDAHCSQAGGAWRVRGGPGALTHAMAEAARAAGAEIRTGARVERMLVDNGRAAGVVIEGREQPAAAIVSAVDPKTTFLRLVDPGDLTPDFLMKMRNYRAAGTVAKVNLALSALPAFQGPAEAGHAVREAVAAETLSGRMHIGPGLDYLERAFDHAKYGELSSDPWLDVTIPSVLDPALAPAGAHVMSIYAHYAPYRLRATGWPAANAPLLDRVLATLERFAPGIGELVVASQVISPLELETEYGFYGGHVFHGELALDQLAMMRPILGYGRYAGPIDGLFLCSAGTHPGGFMTGGSGKLAARVVTGSDPHTRHDSKS